MNDVTVADAACGDEMKRKYLYFGKILVILQQQVLFNFMLDILIKYENIRSETFSGLD